MGFELWTDGELAWARGTYEYRPLGVAVIAACDLFRRRDFHPRNRPPGAAADYIGAFASLGHMNAWLQAQRRATFTSGEHYGRRNSTHRLLLRGGPQQARRGRPHPRGVG